MPKMSQYKNFNCVLVLIDVFHSTLTVTFFLMAYRVVRDVFFTGGGLGGLTL